ncbi:MAG: hypothetical protein COW76_18830 [Shewanella sp. CG18_big_fil_WC_8_21_14_2_50_42_11]|uniref:hypothetical protein n=1 Tax=Shewanella sp. CG18_big_fil_WC_8_21_14_2_50_42_11 TaxID=1975538 RepID=UPI000C692EEB|nr:hypothetical protein [Shewanella sp. CG18_big_fil_WC_8_21_14_2_50_42_11]PIP98861.1 MAG: hypothetical protein COW76_18830 [Shewanella sp. CG18_big_fil_WC_8_21_14_2_50_42_11]
MSKLLFLIGLVLLTTGVLASDVDTPSVSVYWRDVAVTATGIVSVLIGVILRMHLSADSERRSTLKVRLDNFQEKYDQVFTIQADLMHIRQDIKVTERRISRIEDVLIPSGWRPREQTGD